MVMMLRMFALAQTDKGSTAELQAERAADLNGIRNEFLQTGLNVRLCDASLVNDEVWIPVHGHGSADLVQSYFSQPLRVVSRKQMHSNDNFKGDDYGR